MNKCIRGGINSKCILEDWSDSQNTINNDSKS
jgi:hypothetical protein